MQNATFATLPPPGHLRVRRAARVEHARGHRRRRQQRQLSAGVERLCACDVEVVEADCAQQALRQLPWSCPLQHKAHVDNERLGGAAHEARHVRSNVVRRHVDVDLDVLRQYIGHEKTWRQCTVEKKVAPHMRPVTYAATLFADTSTTISTYYAIGSECIYRGSLCIVEMRMRPYRACRLPKRRRA
eukprot:251841-Chlamydomonas_euryale.AAC.2